MTLKETVNKYANKEMDAISLIRILSGAFNPDHAISILVIICQVTRVEQGDLDIEDFKAMYGIGETK